MPSTKVRYIVSLAVLFDVTETFVAVVAVVALPESVPAANVFVLGL